MRSYPVCFAKFCISTALVLSGCASAPGAKRVSDKAYFFEVNAAGQWQDSGVSVRKGYIINIEPEGEWGDKFETFGPGGNAKVIKTHHLVKAPAYALLMKISCETNFSHLVAGPTNITASRSGTIQFRANTSLPEDAAGAVRVVFFPSRDSDGDQLSDEDEISIWKTDPLNPDTDGNGFSDYEDARHTLERRKLAEKQRGLD